MCAMARLRCGSVWPAAFFNKTFAMSKTVEANPVTKFASCIEALPFTLRDVAYLDLVVIKFFVKAGVTVFVREIDLRGYTHLQVLGLGYD